MKKNKSINYSNKDFVEELLPHNRKEQFKFIFKNRKTTLFLIGLFSLLFALPYIILNLFKNNFTYNIYMLFEKGAYTDVETSLLILENLFVFSLLNSISILVYAVFLSGAFNVLKKIVFGDPVFFMHDLLKGIKNNILSFSLIGLVIDFFIIVVSALLRYFGIDLWFILAFLILIIILLPYFLGLLFYKSIYRSAFKETLINGLALFKNGGIKGMLLLIGSIVVPLVNIILSDLLVITSAISLIINVIYFLFFLPTYLLLTYCYYMSIFDVRINKNEFPSYFMKGLYKGKPNEEENS